MRSTASIIGTRGGRWNAHEQRMRAARPVSTPCRPRLPEPCRTLCTTKPEGCSMVLPCRPLSALGKGLERPLAPLVILRRDLAAWKGRAPSVPIEGSPVPVSDGSSWCEHPAKTSRMCRVRAFAREKVCAVQCLFHALQPSLSSRSASCPALVNALLILCRSLSHCDLHRPAIGSCEPPQRRTAGH